MSSREHSAVSGRCGIVDGCRSAGSQHVLRSELIAEQGKD